MAKATSCEVPEGSLLQGFGAPGDYRDCFALEVPGEVSLADYIERFYCSPAFLPERLALRLIAGRASRSDARALARGEAGSFAVWEVVERSSTEILLHSKGTGTASWLAVKPLEGNTRLLFGSWVGGLESSGWRFMERPHHWYSRWLLGGV
ncbi:hypothetical protein [Erythrobacter sp. HKB08]|uniref:hypothetical protein n=1 Tax=Erythrobacter sp. HKB08 TaxID=2502843 RepID=UPI001008CB5B|nr:hypothetical protein [Erythrobacter sp. HKB08]